MNTSEKFAKFDALVVETGISEDELTQWFEARKTLSVAADVATTSSIEMMKSFFPIAYKKGNEFEILPGLVWERKDEVWGYEIMPNIILAKKYGADGNVEDTCWYNIKTFAENCLLNGKHGRLPSEEVLKKNWYTELKNKISEMDQFLCANDIDATSDYCGCVWCYEDGDRNHASCFYLNNSYCYRYDKIKFGIYDRLAVAF